MSDLVQAVEWSPPLDTGLSDDSVYLSEQIEYHADGGPSSARQPGVYVLELSLPSGQSTETYHRLFLQHRDTVPDWIESIINANRLLYVGFAKDVYDRLHTHLNAPNQSSTVANVFPIHSIQDIHWFDTPGEASDHEYDIGYRLRDENPDAYVHFA